MTVKLLTEHHLEFLSLQRGCTVLSVATLVKMPHYQGSNKENSVIKMESTHLFCNVTSLHDRSFCTPFCHLLIFFKIFFKEYYQSGKQVSIRIRKFKANSHDSIFGKKSYRREDKTQTNLGSLTRAFTARTHKVGT